MNDHQSVHRSRRAFLKTLATGSAALTLAACGAGASGSSSAPATGATSAPGAGSGNGQTIRIALFGSRDDAARREKLIPAFQEKNPGVNIEYIPIQGTDWEEFFSKVLASIAAGNTPDLTFCATEGTHLFAGKGLATPLDDYVKRDQQAMQEYFSDVHPALVEAMMYEGNLYELPIDFNAANMYVNTTLLNEAGFADVSSDWDRDRFYEVAQKITQKDAGGQTTVFGYQWVNRLWGSWMPWIFVNGSNLLTEERAPGGEWLWDSFYKDDPAREGRGGGWRWNAPKANDPANLEALEFMVQLNKEGITPGVELGSGQSLQGFFSGNKLGMTPAGGFWAGGLHNAGMAADAFDVRLFPKWKSQRHQFGTAGYVLMKDSPNKDLGWEYLKYLASKEAMTIDLASNETTPTRRSMMTAERYATTGPKSWQVFYDTLDKHPDTAPIPAPPEANPMTTIFTKYTGLAMSLEMSPKDALDAMQADLEALFAKRSG